jgi:hypothetical protein
VESDSIGLGVLSLVRSRANGQGTDLLRRSLHARDLLALLVFAQPRLLNLL